MTDPLLVAGVLHGFRPPGWTLKPPKPGPGRSDRFGLAFFFEAGRTPKPGWFGLKPEGSHPMDLCELSGLVD